MAVADGAATISVVAVLADQAELFGTVTRRSGSVERRSAPLDHAKVSSALGPRRVAA